MCLRHDAHTDTTERKLARMTKQQWFLKIILNDGSEVEVTPRNAAETARMYSEQGRMADWQHNPNHPDWLAAEAALTSYRRFLIERKHYKRCR